MLRDPVAGRRHQRGYVMPEAATGTLQGGADVGPQAYRVVVAHVERHPRSCSGPSPAGQPLREQDGLSETGGCGIQGDPAGRRPVELVEQALPLDPPLASRWLPEL
jgi:hypothetical protein